MKYELKMDLPSCFSEIIIEKNYLLKSKNNSLERYIKIPKVLIIIDSNVKELHPEKIEIIKNSFNGEVFEFVLISDEKNKTMNSVVKITNFMIDNNFNRDGLVVAIGGGIIGDLAGFISSIYMRGIKYIQIPTTLLAAVDSSVGGKTAVNSKKIKNIIGAFYQPELVVVDSSFFETLPEKELICGYGEIIKYGFLIDSVFLNQIKKIYNEKSGINLKAIDEIVYDCIKFKISVVTIDEKEQGIRKILNLGHTFGHAIEVEQKYNLGHGQAVIIGIASALFLSNKLDIISDAELTEYLSFMVTLKDKIIVDKFNVNKIIDLMYKDKKNYDNEIKFVLIKAPGEVITDLSVSLDDVIYSINNGISLFLR